MKTNYLFRYVKFFTIYIIVFLWTAFKVNAQCPTVNDPSPTICLAAGYTFADLSADYVTNNGGGITWYNNATGGNSIGSLQIVQEGTYYADDNSGSCVTRQPLTVTFQVDPVPIGASLDKFYCGNENATIQDYIDDALALYIPSGVAVYYDLALTNQANTSDVIANSVINYFIVFDDGACSSQIKFGKTIVSASPADPTPASSQDFCSVSNPTIGDIDPGTAATSYSWYDNPGAVAPALSTSTPLVDGNTYYVQVEDYICFSNPVPVTVTINNPYDPGTSASLEYCDDSIPGADFDLFDELGGSPDTNGTWSGALATTNGYQGTVNITTLTVGVHTFTYTVPSNGICPEDTANVTVTIYETFTSGTVSPTSPATFCEPTAPSSFDLFSLLDNEDAGGQWTQGTLSTDSIVTSPFNLTGLVPATYNFTYTQNISTPCPEESTTVQVVILADPNAGNGSNQIFCENDLATNSPYDLFTTLDGSQDNDSGTWTDASNTTISNSLDLTTLTVAGSPYSFNYTIDNGTCSDTETITITLQPAPESGTAIATFPEFCEGNAPVSFDLFDLLDNEDQTGTWYVGTDNLGATIPNPVDLSSYTDGIYDFTYDVNAIGSCDDVLVTVSVTINPLPNTGTPTAAIFCENDLVPNSPLDLFTQLSGEDTGGTWTDDNTTGALNISDVDLTLLTIGSYNFTYTITDSNTCTNSSTVTVTIEEAPESGTTNTPVELCLADITTGQTFDLFDLLTGEDQTGSWADDDNTLALTGNTVTIDGLAQGTYSFTYDVSAIGTCDDVDVTVSIIINDTTQPIAATPQEFCDTATIAELLATGNNIQWYADATGGTPLTSTDTLVDGEDYFATQTDATTGCESSVRTQVIATIYQSPNAGNPVTPSILACSTDNNIDLDSGLDGTQDAGGVWQDTDATGALTGNIFDATAVTPGMYQFTYYVTASAPCIDDFTIITITVEEPFSAGTDNTLDVCSNNGTTDLFTLIGSADVGGTWSPALASGTGVFDPLIDAPGTYTYTLTNSCGIVSSDVVVTVTQAPNSGADNSITICVIDGITDLFTFLGSSAQTGGTWSPALTSGTGEFDPLIDTAGTYTYTVTAVAPCSTDSAADIIVTISDSPAPIILDANPEFCQVDNPTVVDLNGAIRVTGTASWYADDTLSTPLNLTDALVDGEDYFARQTTTSGCESSQSVQITATVNNVSTPTLINSNLELCINDDPTIMELTINIFEYDTNLDNVIWYDVVTGGLPLSNSSLLNYGVTYYATLYDTTTGCESSVRLAYTPDLTSCGELVLPDGFSPNGDGTNDTFDYNNIEILYPNFSIEIFNRYGTVIFKGNPNSPRFDGTSNQGGLGKKQLPVGVYFYIFNFNDGTNKPKQGRLYLSR